MKLIQEKKNLEDYLSSTDIIDYDNYNIQEVAEEFSILKNEMSIIKKVYEYVRDNISHSFDIDGSVVTCSASEVLKAGEGICYAKSHLLAAILRYLKIPAGFCYQKLILDDDEKPWLVLHGLNAVYIKDLERWIRIDARGNKEGVNAQFSVSAEKLAFPIRENMGEEDIPIIFAEPDINVINSLRRNNIIGDLVDDLPSELAKDFTLPGT